MALIIQWFDVASVLPSRAAAKYLDRLLRFCAGQSKAYESDSTASPRSAEELSDRGCFADEHTTEQPEFPRGELQNFPRLQTIARFVRPGRPSRSCEPNP